MDTLFEIPLLYLLLSIVIPLTTDVLAYMQDNGTLVLPEGSQPEPEYRTNTEDESDAYEDWEHCRTTGTSVEVSLKVFFKLHFVMSQEQCCYFITIILSLFPTLNLDLTYLQCILLLKSVYSTNIVLKFFFFHVTRGQS